MARRDFDRAARIPPDLVEALSRTTALAQDEWARARAQNRYALFAPWLERILDLQREVADALGYPERRYDALLDRYEPGLTAAELDRLFAGLEAELVPLARAVLERADPRDDAPLHGDFDEERQRRFIEGVLRDCGFDFDRGRQDRSVHPFCTSFSRDDVRITTRYDRRFLPKALFGSLHEMGHALYEQGIAPELDGTLLAGGASLGVHESQSRLWENLVGRSREFWSRYYPELRAAFPEALGGVDVERFYRAINRVSPTFIRVEADEVTYNLHILVRYELEEELLEGRLSVADAPEAWNARVAAYLGRTPPDDASGILQDIHWSIGLVGYFPTYTLGNILAAQLWEKALEEAPSIPADIEAGRFGTLLDWLRERVHRHGRKFLPAELIQRATGRPLDAGPYIRYLKAKFGALYGIRL